MSFKPLHDRVLVRRIDGDEKTLGGLIIPETAKEKPQIGEAHQTRLSLQRQSW